uniref:Uncharacterized protein n=1 Tax=Romanomermis culicivorax TaxID=13658 RepID=A0A915HJQ5_ROMCU
MQLVTRVFVNDVADAVRNLKVNNIREDEMAMAAENHFTTEALMFGQEGLATESGIVSL